METPLNSNSKLKHGKMQTNGLSQLEPQYCALKVTNNKLTIRKTISLGNVISLKIKKIKTKNLIFSNSKTNNEKLGLKKPIPKSTKFSN